MKEGIDEYCRYLNKRRGISPNMWAREIKAYHEKNKHWKKTFMWQPHKTITGKIVFLKFAYERTTLTQSETSILPILRVEYADRYELIQQALSGELDAN
jgi:hypothetical protein